MRKKLRIGFTTFLCITCFYFMSCENQVKKSSKKLTVVATTGMIADVVSNIGSDHVEVISLMGPGIDPHLYKASAGDVKKLSSADLILYNGLHLEAKMGEVLEKMETDIQTIAVANSIDPSLLLADPEYKNAHDPHVWFDVSLWKYVALGIRNALIKAEPENEQVYKAGYAEYIKKMDELDQYVKVEAAKIPAQQRVLITAHDAFGYFGQAYGFKVKGLQGISTVAEAGTSDVQKLSDYITQNKIKAVFIESSVPRKNVEALQAAVKARGFHVKIGGELFSDAMGDKGTEEGTYLGMVKHNIDTIVGALK